MVSSKFIFDQFGRTMDKYSPWSKAEKWQIMALMKFWIWLHHLKGLLLSFQKILKMLTLDHQRKPSYGMFNSTLFHAITWIPWIQFQCSIYDYWHTLALASNLSCCSKSPLTASGFVPMSQRLESCSSPRDFSQNRTYRGSVKPPPPTDIIIYMYTYLN